MVAFGPQGVVTGPAAPGSLLELQTPPPPRVGVPVHRVPVIHVPV